MATLTNYDVLYENMKNRLTVVNDNSEYTIGDYMLMQVNRKREDSLLPVAERSTTTPAERAVATAISYINDKLTIKELPQKDKTIRAFPFRASASAFLSAVVACTFMLSFVAIGARLGNTEPEVAQICISEEIDVSTATV